MAFQMAEEKFASQQYKEAVDFLNKAETALGRTNPPMAYLKVMIADQLAYKAAKEDNGLEILNNLKSAIADFEATQSKEELGEEKIMNIYRLKMGLEERKSALEKGLAKLTKQRELFEGFVNRLSSEYPKTNIAVGEFLKHPMAWNVPNYYARNNVNDKVIQRIIDGEASNSLFHKTYYYSKLDPGKLLMERIKTTRKGVDNIDEYVILQFTREIPFTTEIDKVSYQQVAELLKIPDELSMDVFEGSNWIQSGNWYSIFYESKEKKHNGEPRKFELHVLKEMIHYESQNFGKKSTYQSVGIKVTENTL